MKRWVLFVLQRQRLQIEESMSPDDSRSGHVDSKRPRSLDLEASKPRKVIPETSKDDIGVQLPCLGGVTFRHSINVLKSDRN